MRSINSTAAEWKCILRASPSHKPQQLSSTAPGMCRKGCSLTTAEVRSSLRSGWQHQHEPADSYEVVKRKRQLYLWRGKKSTQQHPLYKPIHHILEFIKTGSAKLSVTMQHLFYQDFGKGAKSPSLTGQLRASYLVMLCISWELHSQLPESTWAGRALLQGLAKMFYVDSWSIMSVKSL